jgi:hypothetical protein
LSIQQLDSKDESTFTTVSHLESSLEIGLGARDKLRRASGDEYVVHVHEYKNALTIFHFKIKAGIKSRHLETD